MALEMGKAMDPNVTKESLMAQADYYVTEINKVYAGFDSDGKNKLSDISTKKTTETKSLTTDIESLQQELQSIQLQLSQKQSALSQIDQRYQPEIEEIGQKLMANEMVKDKFVSTINLVKMNISNNLK